MTYEANNVASENNVFRDYAQMDYIDDNNDRLNKTKQNSNPRL